ncbi:MAG TPA: hypothetical protein VJZ49_09805, partial [Syntrophales bacterium]|nr:hypothetical protein [Syntrophales bacterium]
MDDKKDATEAKAKETTKEISLKDPSLLLNRELSWIEFNRRVLEEAEDPETPALEKLKFISIFSSNLDEFFQVRVGALARLIQAGVIDPDPSGLTPRQQIEAIAVKARIDVAQQYQCFQETVLPLLKQAGIEIQAVESLDKKETQKLNAYFENQVFPILTPLAVDAGHPFPFLGNLRLNLMVMFKESPTSPQPYAFVDVPSVLPRLIRVMDDRDRKEHHFVLLEDLIGANIGSLFPGMKITNCVPFRLTRNQDYDLHEDTVMDLLKSVEAELKDLSNKIA